MNKKAVIILSVVAILFSVAAMALWFTGKGKIDRANTSLDALKEFTGQPATFDKRLKAPAAAAAEIAKLRDEGAKKDEDIASKASRIASLEGKLKESETRGNELEVKATDLTRERDDLTGKVDALTAAAKVAENKVKDLEERAAKAAEEAATKTDELQKQIDSDKKSLVEDMLAARRFYSQLYNFSTSKGLKPPLSQAPWDTGPKIKGPQFIKTVHVAQLVGFDARQALLILNVGSDAGIEADQGYDLVVGDKPVAKVHISDVINGSVSTAVYAPGSPTPTLAVGTAVKLVPFGVLSEDTSEPVAPVITLPPHKTAQDEKHEEKAAEPAPAANS